MTIRPATPDDVSAVLPMVAATCAFHEALDAAKYGFKPQPQEMYRDWLGRRATDPRSVFLVAERQAGQLVGFLIGTVDAEIPIYRLKEYGFIQDLWVEPDYRHEGLARQMVMLAVERFAAMGVTQMRADVAAGNEAARKLFAKCGLRESTVEMLTELK